MHKKVREKFSFFFFLNFLTKAFYFSFLESSEKPVSRNSSKATVHLPSETRKTVSRLLTSITVIESSGLMTRFGTEKDNGTMSPFPTQNLASSMKTTSHWSSKYDITTRMRSISEPVMRTSESDEMKTVSSFSLAHGTSSWDGDDFSKMSSFTESSKENTHSFHLPVSSLAITISTSVAQKAIFSSSSLSAQKKEATGSTSVKSPTATLQDIGTLVKVPISEANYIWSTLSTAFSGSSVFTYSKSVIEDIDFQLTTAQSYKHSKLGRSSSLAITTANLGSSTSSSKNSVKVILGETNIATDMTPIIFLTTAKSGLSSSLYSSSFEGGSSGNTFSQQWVFSQSTAPVQTSIVVDYTSVKSKSSYYDHYGSPASMQVSPTPTSGFIYGSVTSFKKDHKTSHLFTPLSHTASRLISKEQPSNHSEYLSENTLTVMMTPFPFSSLSSNQGDLQEIHTPTTVTSLTAAKQQSDPTSIVPRSAKLEISTFPPYISLSRSNYSTVAAVEDITSLETTSSRSSHLKRSSSIGQSQSSIKAISFSNTVPLNTNSDTGSSSLSSYPGEISSLPVAWVSSHASTSSYTSFEDLPTVTSEMTSTNSVSTNQTSGSYRSSSIFKETFTPKEMSSRGNVGLSSVSSSVQVQQLTSKKSIPPTTFSTISTNNTSKTHHHTLHKSTSGVPTKSSTGVRITRVLTSRQYTALSEGILSLITSSPTDAITSRIISSHSEDARLSIITSSGEHRTPNISHRTSQHLTLYTALSDSPEISTLRLFPVTTVASNTKGTLNAVSASRRTSSQVDDVVLSSATFSTVRPRSRETSNVSLSRPNVQSVSSTTLHETLVNDSSGTPTNSTVTGITIATLPSSIQSTVLSRNMSSASRIITPAFSNISLNTYNTTHSLYASTTGNVMIFPNANYTSKTQVKPIRTTDSYLLSTVVTTFRPILNTTTQFKIMDGSFIIRNKHFHANLSNPNTTMFKDLADEVEEIITEIVFEDSKVTSFRNGSVIADFYLMVAYDSPFSDQDYAQMLSEANKTLWRGYFVTNITVTLRDYTERPAARLQESEGLSKGAVVAIFAVFSLLLIAVGSTGVYFCTKKGMCERSRVKPSV